MPLIIKDLEKGIKNAIVLSQKELDFEKATEVYVREFAKVVDSYIKSGDVNTVGNSSAQKGKIT